MKTFEELIYDLDIDFTTKGYMRFRDAERIAKEYARLACEEQKKICVKEWDKEDEYCYAPLPELK